MPKVVQSDAAHMRSSAKRLERSVDVPRVRLFWRGFLSASPVFDKEISLSFDGKNSQSSLVPTDSVSSAGNSPLLVHAERLAGHPPNDGVSGDHVYHRTIEHRVVVVDPVGDGAAVVVVPNIAPIKNPR
jgi:hypothetical protein